jgi:hypothetical protein
MKTIEHPDHQYFKACGMDPATIDPAAEAMMQAFWDEKSSIKRRRAAMAIVQRIREAGWPLDPGVWMLVPDTQLYHAVGPLASRLLHKDPSYFTEVCSLAVEIQREEDGRER